MLEGRWRAYWDLPNDTFWMEPRPELPSVIPNPFIAPETVDRPRHLRRPWPCPVAIDEDGNVISWRPKQDPHFLTTGKTGKGKTVCELGVIGFLAAHGWEIWGIDGKRFEMLGLRTWPNVKLIAGRIDHQARVAHEVYEEMQRRMAAYEAGSIRLEEFVPILFVIDEFQDLPQRAAALVPDGQAARGCSTAARPRRDQRHRLSRPQDAHPHHERPPAPRRRLPHR